MTDKPILFSAPMVRALLEGRKTQTRRVLKPQPCNVDKAGCWYRMPSGRKILNRYDIPYATGDRLWVREAWRATESLDHLSPTEIGKAATDAGYRGPWCPYMTVADEVVHNWSDEDRGVPMVGAFSDEPGRFRQGMHMPRWASRLTLTVTDVRVQRVREISDEDAESEGVLYAETEDGFVMWSGTYWTYPVPLEHLSHFPKSAFRDLWDSLNAKRGFGWDANPWVAAYTFTVETRNIDE